MTKNNNDTKYEELKVGDLAFVRTSTFDYCGTIAKLDMTTIVLIDYAWIADTGRFSKWAAGELDGNAEVEHAPDGEFVELNRMINHVCSWRTGSKGLLRKTK